MHYDYLIVGADFLVHALFMKWQSWAGNVL